MRHLLSAGLSLSLGFLVGTTQAEEIQWRPVASRPAMGAPAGAVQPASPETDAGGSNRSPLASLGRPVPLSAAAVGGEKGPSRIDRRLTTVSYRGAFAADVPPPLVRARSAEPIHTMPTPTPDSAGPPTVLNLAPPAGPPPVPAPEGDCTSSFGCDCCPEGGCCAAGPLECCPCDGPACLGPDCCAPCQERSYRFWVSGEYLLWRIKSSRFPPLVTASPLATPTAGIIGDASTQVLFGGGNANDAWFSGGRFTTGLWLDSCQTLALEGTFLFLDQRTNHFFAGSPGTPGSLVLARPFISAVTGAPLAELVAFPGMLAGRVAVDWSSSLWGGEANLRWHHMCGSAFGGSCYKVDLLAGFRYLELREKLGITENLSLLPGTIFRNLPGNIAGPGSIVVNDQFRTNNQFYGGQIGAEAELRRGRWFLDTTGKLALGWVHQTVDINGSTLSSGGVPSGLFPGGLLAQPGTNIGHYARSRFAVLPELGVKFGYQVTDDLRVFVGYDFLYLSRVARPGDQIDQRVDPALLIKGGTPIPPTVPLPTHIFRDTDFWAYGVNFGLEYRF